GGFLFLPLGPLAAEPLAEPADVGRADGHLRQFVEIRGGLAEGRRRAPLADDLPEQAGAIPLGAQLQALVQRGKKRPDRSHTTTARAATRPSRPASGAAGVASAWRGACGGGRIGHTWGSPAAPRRWVGRGGRC